MERLKPYIDIMKNAKSVALTNAIEEKSDFTWASVAAYVLENESVASVSEVAKRDFFSPNLQMKLLDLLENPEHPLYENRNSLYGVLAKNLSLSADAQERIKEKGGNKPKQFLAENKALIKKLRMEFAQNGTQREKEKLARNLSIDDEEAGILSGYNHPEINTHLELFEDERKAYRAGQAAASSSSNPPPQSSNT